MRVFKRKGIFYFESARGKKMSLHTGDEALAEKMASALRSEYQMMEFYRRILSEQTKLLKEIEAHTSRISKILSQDNGSNSAKDCRSKGFLSEEEMQSAIMTSIECDFGFQNLIAQKHCQSGIVDAVGVRDGKRTALEFKLGTIRELHLGQCLRYLKDTSLEAEELWLIGEDFDKSASVFVDFPNIKLFITTRSNKSKKMIREVHSLSFYEPSQIKRIAPARTPTSKIIPILSMKSRTNN